MSSIYRPICLSHDPAIELDFIEWQSGRNGLDILENALRDPSVRSDLGEHARCELVGGRFSYPLVEVYCPPVSNKDRHPGLGYHPHSGEWVSANWLRLLLAAHDQENPSPGLVDALERNRCLCWPVERLRKLRGLL